ncbi:OXA-1206 family carbapenem-hydrolyzing class D beta-lactamase [Cupriavidus agavae]|uniref:beta-lactamase n=2 Tax=Cupriavidus agavae TaxID=1001822 RepID=A0A4Q7REF7_9BURK|nr:beta-lactamase class D [Cupriavidus agavae]
MQNGFSHRNVPQRLARLLLATALVAGTAHAAPQTGPLDARPLFDAAGTDGTMVIHNVREQRTLVYNPKRAATAYSPASTFKIFNTLIGLETGAVADVDHDKLPWDGKVWMHHGKPILPAVCNGDVALRAALPNSCVPAYQALARRVGTVQYRKYLTAAHFGNADVEGPVDRFWLNGHLKITALQQVAFLRDAAAHQVPLISARSFEALDDILTIEKTADYTLRAKTGWDASGDAKADVGWWVGWVTRGADTWVFALNLDMPRPELGARRQEIARAMLRQVGALP